MKPQPLIGITYIEGFPSHPIDAFEAEMLAGGLRVQKKMEPVPGPYALLEWLIPTGIVIYISKSYFDGMLKEMGKEHYHLLKGGIKKLARSYIGPLATKVKLRFTKGKSDSTTSKYSMDYSIVSNIDTGIRVKLLLQPNLSETQCDAAIDAFLGFLLSYHEGTLEGDLLASLQGGRPVGGILLVSFNQESSVLEVVDPIPKHVRERTQQPSDNG